MITTEIVVPDEKVKETYMDTWCRDTGGKWKECKRFSCKAALGFCPDFVLPDTKMSIEEIMDKFDDES